MTQVHPLVAQLHETRLRLGITQVDLAARVGVNPATIVNLERGHRGPHLFTAECIANALGLELKLVPKDER